MNRNENIRSISKRAAVVGLTAAVYYVLTVALAFMAYGDIQFRVSEIMNLLVFINPVFAPGVVLGCFLANLHSPFGPIDWIVGTLHSALSVFLITKTKSLPLACFFPVIGGLIVAAMLMYVLEIPLSVVGFITVSAIVLLGQAVVMYGAGYPVFKFFIMKNEKLMAFIKGL